MKLARNFGILALVALLLTAAPGGGTTIDVALTLLNLAFFAAIGYFGFRLYREHRTFTLDALGERRRLLFYAALGVAVLTFAGTSRLFANGGPGVLVWLALLALSSFAVFRVFASRY